MPNSTSSRGLHPRWLLACAALAALALATPAASRADDGPSKLGLQLDAGWPGGAVAAIVYRPIWPLRVDAGVSYNLIGFGLRGGVTLVPWKLSVSPSLRGEFGHTFTADASGFVGNFTDLTPAQEQALARFGYDYATLQLGLELGNPDSFIFFVRGGLAWLWGTARDVEAAAQEQDPRITAVDDPSISARTLCASLGVVFFW